MTRARSLRLLLLLLALAATVFFYEAYRPPARDALLVQGMLPDLPDVVRPEGQLQNVFKAARPASLQIEINSGALAVATVPLGVGTGFFVSPGGLVLTAYHVIDPGPNFVGEESLVARRPNGQRYPLRLVGFDAYRDLALLQAVGARAVPYLPLASQELEVGSSVVAIGNSRGEFLQGRAGEVRRLDAPAVQASFADGTVEISAALAPGDSGGPVLSDQGEVIGVVSYIAFSPEGPRTNPSMFPLLQTAPTDDGYAAYAIPVADNSVTLSALEAGERRDVPVIGFEAGVPGLRQDYDPRNPDSPDLGNQPGVIIGVVSPGGPAASAGLRDAVQRQRTNPDGSFRDVVTLADVVVAVDGERTPTYEDLSLVLRRRQVGEVVEVEVQRGGEVLRLELELGGKRAVFGG